MGNKGYLSNDNFGEIYEKYFKYFIGVVINKFNYDVETSKDIVQDAMIRAFEKKDQFRGDKEKVIGWFYKIVVNTSLNFAIKEGRKKINKIFRGYSIPHDHLTSRDSNPEEILISREKYEEYEKYIRESLKDRPPSEKVSIEGRFLLDLKCIEISREYDLHESTPKKIVCLFKKKHSKSLAMLLN